MFLVPVWHLLLLLISWGWHQRGPLLGSSSGLLFCLGESRALCSSSSFSPCALCVSEPGPWPSGVFTRGDLWAQPPRAVELKSGELHYPSWSQDFSVARQPVRPTARLPPAETLSQGQHYSLGPAPAVPVGPVSSHPLTKAPSPHVTWGLQQQWGPPRANMETWKEDGSLSALLLTRSFWMIKEKRMACWVPGLKFLTFFVFYKARGGCLW